MRRKPARLTAVKLLTVEIHFLSFFLLFPADSSSHLGLPVLRGVKNPVPRCSDADPPQRGPDPTGPVAAGRLPDLQADDARPICGRLPHLHAGTGENSKCQRRSPKVFKETILYELFIYFNFSRKSLLNQEVFLHQP